MSLPIFAAAVASFVVGFIWYLPGVFGNAWMAMIGMSQKEMEDGKNTGMASSMVVGFIAQLIMAFVLYMFMEMNADTSPAGGAAVGALAWLGFVATTMLGSVLWEKRPVKLFLLNAAHWLVALIVMGFVLGYMT